MPKPKIPNQKKTYENVNKKVSASTNAGVSKAEKTLASKAALLANKLEGNIPEGDQFKFDSHPYAKKEIDDMFADFQTEMNDFILQEQKNMFVKLNASVDKIGEVIDNFYRGAKGNSHVVVKYATADDVLKAFHDRIDANGLNISKRLWKISGRYKTAIEDAISVAINKGQGPVALSHRLIKYLNDYDSLNDDYKKKFGTARKAKDCHYAAFRLAYTEIQMAYREAERRRWLEMDDIVGMRIRTHENKHKVFDTCDALAGVYPKTFKWLGWHPICHCYAVPILRDDAKEARGQVVTDVPENFKEWVAGNTERIAIAEERKTLPYFLADNKNVWKTQPSPVALGSKDENFFSPEAYSQERKDNALWDKEGGRLADDALRPSAGRQWREAKEQQQTDVFEYTANSNNVNYPLQGRQYIGKQKIERFTQQVNNITNYLDSNRLEQDMWLQRGDRKEAIEARVVAAGGEIPTDLSGYVGKEMYELGFLSTGSAKGKGFTDRPVILNIYAPKGTKASYLEPISAKGDGGGLSWDGKTTQKRFSEEQEALLQRGTRLRITKVEEAPDEKIYIDCEVVEQAPKDISYVRRNLISK